LRIAGELLGVLALFRRDPISNEEFVILSAFANRAAMAVQNARFHSEIRELNLNLEQNVEDRTEELRLANAKLRRADQLKSEFLANISPIISLIRMGPYLPIISLRSIFRGSYPASSYIFRFTGSSNVS